MGATRPPAFKDFARELGRLMPKKRHEIWRNGKRVKTCTVYHVPEPDALAGTTRATASTTNGAGASCKADVVDVNMVCEAATSPVAFDPVSAREAEQVLLEARRCLPDATLADAAEALVQTRDAARMGEVPTKKVLAAAVDALRLKHS
jgi:hypothetical protein